jgi:Ca2+-binding EF-hand superfamily protein
MCDQGWIHALFERSTVNVANYSVYVDKDGSGFLEIEELGAVLAAGGHRYSDAQLQEAVDHIAGRKGSDGLTFMQFANLLRIKLSSALETRIKRRFDVFDADQSGEVSLEEFTACVQGLDGLITTTEAAAMFKECDLDGSESVSLQEFMKVMERRLSVATEMSVTPSSPNFEANCTHEIFSAPAFNTTIWDDKQSVLHAHISEVGAMDAAEPDTRSSYWRTCTLF